MATERIWDIQGFSGGESDDIFQGPKDSFYSGENISIRTNLSGFGLSAKVTDTTWVISGTICYMENLEKFGLSGIVVCTESGNVYLNGTLKTTFNTGTNAYNRVIGINSMFVSGTQYLYYVTKTSSGTGKIHRSTTDLGTFSVSYKSFTTSSSGASTKCNIIADTSGDLFVSINNIIFSLESVGETVTTLLTFPDNEGIIGFTTFQNNYKIYSNLGTSSLQYFWDGGTAIDYKQIWENSPVQCIINNGSYDYGVFGYNEYYCDMYIISGSQRQEIRVNLEAATSSRTFGSYISMREDIVYISGGVSGESSNYGIYTYGNYYPGTSKSLVQEYSLSTNKFLFHSHSTSQTFLANNDGKIYKVEHNNPPEALEASGYIVTQMYEGNIWEEKAINKIKIGYNLQSGDSIKIYLRNELVANWTTVKTLSYSSYGTKHSATIYEPEINALGFGNFSTLQMKIEITHTGSVLTGQQTIVKRVTTFMKAVETNQ